MLTYVYSLLLLQYGELNHSHTHNYTVTAMLYTRLLLHHRLHGVLV
jgi:hypothetical protein